MSYFLGFDGGGTKTDCVLLDAKGAAYEEIDIDVVPGARQEMQARTGRDTIPQIFINAQHIGGADELQALEAAGGLDPLLKMNGA